MKFLLWRKQETKSLATENDVLASIFFRANEHFTNQVKMIDLSHEDLQNIRRIQEIVQKNLQAIVDHFYERITSVQELDKLIQEHSSIERLKQTLRHHVQEMFSGTIDETYIEKRHKIAKKHVHIGLASKWYIAAFHNLQRSLYEIVFSLALPHEEERQLLLSIDKLINLEQQIVLDEYDQYSKLLIEQEQEKVRKAVKALISDTSHELRSQANETSQLASQLIQGANFIRENLAHSIETTNATKDVCNDGREQANQFKAFHQEIEERTAEIATMIQNLVTSTQEIQQVIEIVNKIAMQTNLLALNSSIEAARAGEYGKGFAVVAEEIRKLANETKNSVERIGSLIETTTEETAEVVDAIEKINELTEQGLSYSAQTTEMFAMITETVDTTISEFQQMIERIHPLVNIVETIDQSSETLSEEATKLDEMIQKF